jgi:hypothetical protein
MTLPTAHLAVGDCAIPECDQDRRAMTMRVWRGACGVPFLDDAATKQGARLNILCRHVANVGRTPHAARDRMVAIVADGVVAARVA